MNDAPEKIWATPETKLDAGMVSDAYKGMSYATEYTRTDIADARIATAREDALRKAASLCEGAGAFADEMEKPILALICNGVNK
tara:strand:- start:41 stop:292 length:252 start_codon:yes stop_codon:yes gene_type:complete